MFNPHAVGDANTESWKFSIFTEADLPKHNVPVFILVESDVIDETDNFNVEYMPFVRPAMLVKFTDQPFTISRWKILDFDPEEEEEYLQQAFTVVAWRYV
jgi:hypothetical protein